MGRYLGNKQNSCNFALQTRNNGYALLAQLVEQLTLNQWVLGSNP